LFNQLLKYIKIKNKCQHLFFGKIFFNFIK